MIFYYFLYYSPLFIMIYHDFNDIAFFDKTYFSGNVFHRFINGFHVELFSFILTK